MRKYETDRPDCLTCVYADANGLHELNNSQGHEAGDKMLKSVARALAEEFEDGSVFRIGGDEFCILTDSREESYAEAIAEAIRARNGGVLPRWRQRSPIVPAYHGSQAEAEARPL